MSGILDFNKGLFSTQEYRNSLLRRNLPPPINDTLIKSGLVSKLEDIGKVINIPINGTSNENIVTHYLQQERLFPLGKLFRDTQNVNLNRYIPQNEVYETYTITSPPNLGNLIPQEFGKKIRTSYPISYNETQFYLVNKGDSVGVRFPFDVIDIYKNLNFNRETQLGLIGGKELEKTIINKISQVEESVNSKLYKVSSITIPSGNVNLVDQYVNKLRGSQLFFDPLPNSVFGWSSSTKKSDEILSTEQMVNTLLTRTSETQVGYLFTSLKNNTFRPLYNDNRFKGTDFQGTNSNYYVGSERNSNIGIKISRSFTNEDFNGTDSNQVGKRTDVDKKFFWRTGGESNFNEKTLLYKTQQLVNNNETDVFINQTKKFFKDKVTKKLVSRGNAISSLELIDVQSNGNYCRVWTVNDNYNYLNAIRNTGLFSSPNSRLPGFSANSQRSSQSVLMDSGIPKYFPTIEDSSTTRKKFMFSIENLAWSDNLADLPIGEIGPGDILSRNKGRIMWFPPYELTFSEDSSASWTQTEFIGRSEPVYTYNNSKRSGSIGFKIIVDHPRVINGYRGKSNNLIERFFAGCITPNDFLRALDKANISQESVEEIKKKIAKKKNQKLNNSQGNASTTPASLFTDPGGTFNPDEIQFIDNLLIDENAYFDFIDGNYPNYFNTISEKIKYFNPGFHSITPEGLNSRLTFLNQCTKQGPSVNDSGSNVQAQNLSFGRPPICIIRIGDFFHTKVVINSVGITYDGPQWDLNPEGIGIQPMIATISLSIDLIGGQSMDGPINRLQNAVSFNYYGNTEVYDPRSDSLDYSSGKIVNGIKLGQLREELLGKSGTDALVESLRTEGIINQSEAAKTGDNTQSTSDNILEIVAVSGEGCSDNAAAASCKTKIAIKTRDGQDPTKIVVNGKSNPSNVIKYEIREDKKEAQTYSSEIDAREIPGFPNLVNYGDKITAVDIAQTNYDNAKTTLLSDFNRTNRDNALNSYTALNTAKKELNTFSDIDKITVIAYLSENKLTTKVRKRFTITEFGLE
jgi:hypothetical protein